jgi:NIMA (never in mitosis gene a)-related kinase
MENFEVKGKLGSGSFSNVFKVVNQKDQKTYAMKKVKMSSLSAKDRQNAINEV